MRLADWSIRTAHYVTFNEERLMRGLRLANRTTLCAALALLLTAPMGCTDAVGPEGSTEGPPQASVDTVDSAGAKTLYTVVSRKGSRIWSEELIEAGMCSNPPSPNLTRANCNGGLRWLSLNRVEEKLIQPKEAERDAAATLVGQLEAGAPNPYCDMLATCPDHTAALNDATAKKQAADDYLTAYDKVLEILKSGYVSEQRAGEDLFNDQYPVHEKVYEDLMALFAKDALKFPLAYQVTLQSPVRRFETEVRSYEVAAGAGIPSKIQTAVCTYSCNPQSGACAGHGGVCEGRRSLQFHFDDPDSLGTVHTDVGVTSGDSYAL
jgi:hypothetical protein